MAEALFRLTYDATIDEAVDVSLRFARRSEAFRKQFQNNVIYVGIGGAVVFFGAWMYIVSASLLSAVFGSVAAVLFGIVFAAVFRSIFDKEIVKQQRKVITEQFGGKPSIPSEIELRPDAVWVRQAGMEMVFPWTLCRNIVKNATDIEMNFTPGICVIRNAHFASPAEQERFFEIAQQLCAGGKATTRT